MSKIKSRIRGWTAGRTDGFRVALAAFLFALLLAPLAVLDQRQVVRADLGLDDSGSSAAAADRRTPRGLLSRAAGAEPGLPASSGVERRFVKWTAFSGGEPNGKSVFLARVEFAWASCPVRDAEAITIAGGPREALLAHHFLSRGPPALRI